MLTPLGILDIVVNWILTLFPCQAVAKMVQECYKYVDEVTDLPIKLRLIDTLRTVTAGKVGDLNEQ